MTAQSWLIPTCAASRWAGICRARLQDELFAAIEGTALHTRVIFDRMESNGVHVQRVINAGGIPQKNEVLNRVYANVLGRPVLVPTKGVTSLGSAIFAFLAAGAFKTIEEAQDKICPPHRVFQSPTPPSGASMTTFITYSAAYTSHLARNRLRWAMCCRR